MSRGDGRGRRFAVRSLPSVGHGAAYDVALDSERHGRTGTMAAPCHEDSTTSYICHRLPTGAGSQRHGCGQAANRFPRELMYPEPPVSARIRLSLPGAPSRSANCSSIPCYSRQVLWRGFASIPVGEVPPGRKDGWHLHSRCRSDSASRDGCGCLPRLRASQPHVREVQVRAADRG